LIPRVQRFSNQPPLLRRKRHGHVVRRCHTPMVPRVRVWTAH
jgi:hypothetical protein